MFTSEEFKLIARADFSFFDDGKIETAAATAHKALDHVVSLELGREFEARKPWRRHADHGGSDAVAVSNRNVRLQKVLGREVLAESSPGPGWIGNFGVPSWVVFGG